MEPLYDELLYDELYGSRIECPLSNKWYIPSDVLHQTITTEKVLAIMNTAVSNQDLLKHSGGAKGIVDSAMRAFATLVIVGRWNPVQDILLTGLADEHLPLTTEGDLWLVPLEDKGKTFKLSRKGWKRNEVTTFLEKQWLFQAPVFDTRGCHLTLRPECALPLKRPIEHIGTTESSRVFTCAIHPAHFKGDLEFLSDQVAIKEIRTEQSFRLEQKNLAAIQGLKNPHLIAHIFTCQRDTLYYVGFPLAHGGSLLSYWKEAIKVPRSGQLVLWALKQMLGLASATRSLHYGLEGETSCRHGDLKPANILYFEENGSGSLVIADLGVSSIHEHPTNQRIGETMTKATTRSYEAPEAYDDESKNLPRSRTYDIWSLGCVFLEFVIWILYDYDAVDNFEKNRKHPYKNPHCSFYELYDGKAAVPEAVKEAFDALKQDSRLQEGGALRALVSLIENNLLVTVVGKRFDAERLHSKLQEILEGAEHTFPNFPTEVNPHSSLPKIFSPPVGVARDHND